LTAEADKYISPDRDASSKEVNSNQKLKLGAEHMAHSSCVEGTHHPLKERELPSSAKPAKSTLASCEGDKKVINDKKVDAKAIPGSCPNMPCVNAPSTVGLPSDEIWTYPCFVFAVKTLTGEILMLSEYSTAAMHFITIPRK
ncbi:hypothetical protein A4A49_51238, partial [Nicotiana attenuata]